ncbi:hypothetical protein M087_4396 [Bacteroides fragilis str. S23 R14]|nr:hypothetical protein M087_4396 [Bacteroides fragilis str. S23 R14]EYE41436.1 hypothetical protein M138_4593 [Bacteroides fragilis str. S23L17]
MKRGVTILSSPITTGTGRFSFIPKIRTNKKTMPVNALLLHGYLK